MLRAISEAVSQYIETPTFRNVCGCLSLSGGTILASCCMLTSPLPLLGACGCCGAPVALFCARYGFLVHLVLVFFLVPTLVILAVWYVIVAIQQAHWLIVPLVLIGMPVFIMVEMRVLEVLRCLFRVLRAGGTGWEMLTAEELCEHSATDSTVDPLLSAVFNNEGTGRHQRYIIGDGTVMLRGEDCFDDYKTIDIDFDNNMPRPSTRVLSHCDDNNNDDHRDSTGQQRVLVVQQRPTTTGGLHQHRTTVQSKTNTQHTAAAYRGTTTGQQQHGLTAPTTATAAAAAGGSGAHEVGGAYVGAAANSSSSSTEGISDVQGVVVGTPTEGGTTGPPHGSSTTTAATNAAASHSNSSSSSAAAVQRRKRP